jgi:uncharacterized protein YdeI (YjbR/CyaY-like superfamily)
MISANPKVDFYFSKAKQWKEEFGKLRIIILDCGLTEGLKKMYAANSQWKGIE